MHLEDDDIGKDVDATAQDVESSANTFFLLFFYYSGIFYNMSNMK